MTIHAKHMTAQMEGDFVVFLIGMRMNKLIKPWKNIPIIMNMAGMLTELGKAPELGLLHARTHFGLRNILVVQYWKSFEMLHAYSTSKTNRHLPAWQKFNRRIGTSGDVGIWHETYKVRAGEYENVYNNMPEYGLGRAGRLVDAKGALRTARARMGGTETVESHAVDADGNAR